jgi:hypothetical protein
MANSDTLLVWAMFAQFAFFLLPGIAWLIDAGIHRRRERHPPMAWAGRRLHDHRSRFDAYKKATVGRHLKPA